MRNITKYSKRLITISLVIASILTLIMVTLLLKFNNQGEETTFIWILAAIAVLAVISIGITVYVRLRKGKYATKLKQDYYEVYERIMDEIQNTTLNIFERKEVLMEIADLLLQAQEDNRKIESVIDGDIDKFIRNIIESFGYRNSIVFNLLLGVQYLVFTLIVVQLAIYNIRGTEEFFRTKIGVMIIPYIIAMCFFLMPLMKHLFAKQKAVKIFVVPLAVVAVYIMFNEILHGFFMHLKWVQFYFDGEVSFITTWQGIIISVSVIAFAELMKQLMRWKKS